MRDERKSLDSCKSENKWKPHAESRELNLDKNDSVECPTKAKLRQFPAAKTFLDAKQKSCDIKVGFVPTGSHRVISTMKFNLFPLITSSRFDSKF